MVIGFEGFRFEDGYAVEHWDNLQPKADRPNRSRSFVYEVLIDGQLERLGHYVDAPVHIEHNPQMSDDLSELRSALSGPGAGNRRVDHRRSHRVLAEGDFVLAISEGFRSGVHTAFYDLFRVANGKVVEHWDTIDQVPPCSEWKNANGQF